MRFFKKIFYKFFPELKPLYNNMLSFASIKNILDEVDKGKMTKLYEPYQILYSKIGKGTYISQNAKISYTNIGKFCSIGPNLICGWGIHPINGISTSPYFYSTKKQNGFSISKEDLIEERKKINIGNDVFIGANVTILDGVTIGDGAVIGAGAVVSKNIPDYAVAYGIPIKIIKYRFNETQIKQLNKIKWWDLEDDKLTMVKDNFFDIDVFINTFKNV